MATKSKLVITALLAPEMLIYVSFLSAGVVRNFPKSNTLVAGCICDFRVGIEVVPTLLRPHSTARAHLLMKLDRAMAL